MTAILTIEPGAKTTDRENPFNMTQDGVEISDLTLHGMAGKDFPPHGATASYGIYAAAITRSVIRNVATKFMGRAQGAGVFLGFGWCNRIEDCDLSEKLECLAGTGRREWWLEHAVASTCPCECYRGAAAAHQFAEPPRHICRCCSATGAGISAAPTEQ